MHLNVCSLTNVSSSTDRDVFQLCIHRLLLICMQYVHRITQWYNQETCSWLCLVFLHLNIFAFPAMLWFYFIAFYLLYFMLVLNFLSRWVCVCLCFWTGCTGENPTNETCVWTFMKCLLTISFTFPFLWFIVGCSDWIWCT